MRKLQDNLLTILAVLVLTISALTMPVRADQPFMQAAIKDLTSAQNSLRRADADKGGHRGNAMKLISQAIGEVNAGIAYANRKQSDFDESSLAAFDQGNMESAKNSLNNALNDLQSADSDKGGHRSNAMRLVRQAIEEVQAGIDFANRH